MPADDDTLDGCEVDFTDHADDEVTASLRPLFPDGTEAHGTADEWKALDDAS